MQSAKETASNLAASAKSGMEKTKAATQEKVEKMTTRDPLKKEMAEQKKDAAFNDAERMKHETRAENAAARREHAHNYGHGGYTATGTGPTGNYSTGTTDLPGATAGAGGGVFGDDYPVGTGHTGVQDPRVTGRRNTDYGSGGTY